MRIIAAFLVIILVGPVSAIVVQDYTAAEAVPSGSGFDLNWDYVYNYKESSAVAVGGAWLLTAGHVADDGGDGSLPNAPGYQQQEIIYHPDVDLALVRYDKAFPGYYDLYASEAPTQDLPGLNVLMVGFGNTGTVTTNNYYTDSGSGNGVKRWGSQIIDRTSIKRYDSDGTVGYTKNRGFLMDFDSGGTTNEAGGATGDSGGGVFYKEGDIWKLAGIMSSRSGGPQYTGTFAITMPDYADWIAKTIPEPAAIGLLGFGTIGLFLARSRKQRRRVGRSILPIQGDEPLCDRFDAGEAERKAGEELRVYAGFLLARLKRSNASTAVLWWLAAVKVRYKEFNKAVWGLIFAVSEKSAARTAIARERLEIAVIKSTDSFLEWIFWDRMVNSVKSARTKTNQALKMSARKGLDAFLETIRWDQMVSFFRRRK